MRKATLAIGLLLLANVEPALSDPRDDCFQGCQKQVDDDCIPKCKDAKEKSGPCMLGCVQNYTTCFDACPKPNWAHRAVHQGFWTL